MSVKTNGDFQRAAVSVRALRSPDAGEKLLLVSFQDLQADPPGNAAPLKSRRGKPAAGSPDARRIQDLERELAYVKEDLQATIEEQLTANEELKSTNEEMQSTNEELQSTNEELETSKEELQSVNEELVTVNAELQAKIEQLVGMQNDMKNLLDNINTGTIFLDRHLLIRRFTREAARIYRLVASDVGRPLADIRTDIEELDLVAEAASVLDILVPWEHEVRTVSGKWYLARIQPYRTLENVIEGVVLTFTDITQRVAAEAAVRHAQELAQGIVDTVREPLIVLNGALQVVSASRSFYRVFQTTSGETVGRPLFELGDRQWSIPALREMLETILHGDRSFEGYAVEHDFPVIGRRRMLLNARRIVGEAADVRLILLAMEEASPAAMEKESP
jgi:two-component system CheB/CheR fusion protein